MSVDPVPSGIAYGLLGAFVLRRVEMWRRECWDDPPGMIEDSIWQQAGTGNRDELLEKGILLGTLPVSTLGWLLTGASLGETSVAIVNKECTDLQKAFLQITGSVSSCVLVHGQIQQALSTLLASSDAVSTGMAPVFATLATAAFEFIVYLLVCERLLPVASLSTRASSEAINVERERCARLFTLGGVPLEVANSRARAFDRLAKQWEEQQNECRKRRETTNFVRVSTAAIVYTISGGSILAPVLTNIVVTDGVLRVLSGKSLSWKRGQDSIESETNQP